MRHLNSKGQPVERLPNETEASQIRQALIKMAEARLARCKAESKLDYKVSEFIEADRGEFEHEEEFERSKFQAATALQQSLEDEKEAAAMLEYVRAGGEVVVNF